MTSRHLPLLFHVLLLLLLFVERRRTDKIRRRNFCGGSASAIVSFALPLPVALASLSEYILYYSCSFAHVPKCVELVRHSRFKPCNSTLKSQKYPKEQSYTYYYILWLCARPFATSPIYFYKMYFVSFFHREQQKLNRLLFMMPTLA